MRSLDTPDIMTLIAQAHQRDGVGMAEMRLRYQDLIT